MVEYEIGDSCISQVLSQDGVGRATLFRREGFAFANLVPGVFSLCLSKVVCQNILNQRSEGSRQFSMLRSSAVRYSVPSGSGELFRMVGGRFGLLCSMAEPKRIPHVSQHGRKKVSQLERQVFRRIVGSVCLCIFHGLQCLGIGIQNASGARRPPLGMLCSSAPLWLHGMLCSSAALLALFGAAVRACHPA